MLWSFFGTMVSPDVAYRIGWGATYVLSGVGTYAFLRHYNASRASALLAGAIFAFAHFHVSRSLGFWGIAQQQWIPFFVLFVEKYLNKSKWQYLVGISIFGLYILASEHHMTVAVVFWLILWIGMRWKSARKILREKTFWIGTAAVAILAGLMGWRVYREIITVAFSSENYLRVSLDWVLKGSNDLMSFIVPGAYHPVWGSFFDFMDTGLFSQREINSSYIGIVVIILLAMLGWAWGRVQQGAMRTQVRRWMIVFVVFALSSMGPILQIFGPTTVPLPYALLFEYVDFLQNVRAVDRFFVIGMFALAVIGGLTFDWFQKNVFKKHKTALAAFLVLAAILTADSLAWDIPTVSAEYSTFYDDLALRDDVTFVLETPGSSSYTYAAEVYYTRQVHKKRIYNPYYFSRKPPRWDLHEKSYPAVRQMLFGRFEFEDIVEYDEREFAEHIFNREKIDYAVVNKQYVGDSKNQVSLEDYLSVRFYIEEVLGLSIVHEDDFLVAYELPQVDHPDVYVLPTSEGFSAPRKSRIYGNYRSLDNNGMIWLNNDRDHEVSGTIVVDWFARDAMNLVVTVDGDVDNQQTWAVSRGYSTIELPMQNIAVGQHEVVLDFEPLNEGAEAISGTYVTSLAWLDDDELTREERIQTNLDFGLEDDSVLVFPYSAIPKDIASPYVLSQDMTWLQGSAVDKDDYPLLQELSKTHFRNPLSIPSAYDILKSEYYYELFDDFIQETNIRRVVLDENHASSRGYSRMKALLLDQGAIVLDRGKGITVFDTSPIVSRASDTVPLPAVFLGDGWRKLQGSATAYSRSLDDYAEIIIAAPKDVIDEEVTLRFDLRSNELTQSTNTLIYVEDKFVDQQQLGAGKWATVEIPVYLFGPEIRVLLSASSADLDVSNIEIIPYE